MRKASLQAVDQFGSSLSWFFHNCCLSASKWVAVLAATRLYYSLQQVSVIVFQGYLKYVPIVGSVLSWFAPPTPTTPEGRTFNLSSGKCVMYVVYIECIENYWRGTHEDLP